MKKTLLLFVLLFNSFTFSWSYAQQWESQSDSYFLTKNTRINFSAPGAGANKFLTKYLTYDGISFLVKGADAWQDYGRLNLGNNNFFSVPIRSGMKIDEVHFLASGNYGNSYEHDSLLHLYGENYYYAVLTVTFAYMDGSYKILSAPVFWDWFHLPSVGWSKDGVKSKAIGINPVRPNCTMYHLNFTNPKPMQAVRNILVSDSWVSDKPFSDVFAVTVRSSDVMQALPRKDL